MNEQPPEQLVALLERLKLANRAQLVSVQRQVNRLANDLPRFESVWVDALAQARIITAYQAAEINAGRGMQLAVGPYLLEQPLDTSGWAEAFRARDTQSRQIVRLTRAACSSQQSEQQESNLKQVVERAKGLENIPVANPIGCGADDSWLWIASEYQEATTAHAWAVHHGRFPANLVLEIARQMVTGLAIFETAQLVHGDIGAQTLLLSKNGSATLVDPLLRCIVRDEEGYAHANAPPEAFDTLAPERVSAGSAPNVKSDLYACGCLWWQLLSGRPPLAGGNRLTKLQSAQAPRILDICQLAPETPQPLATAIAACLRMRPEHRPESFARLSAMLGPATKRDTAALAGFMRGEGPGRVRLRTTATTARHSRWTSVWAAATAGCLVSLAVTLWPQWSPYLTWPQQETVAKTEDVGATQEPTPVPSSANTPEAENTAAPALLPATSNDALPIPQAPSEVATAAYDSAEDGALVIPADRPIHIKSLTLSPGQLVTGPPGKRPQVVVPADGLLIDVNNVRFRRIDFVAGIEGNPAARTMIALQAEQVAFTACRFRGVSGTNSTAINWKLSDGGSEIELSTGNLKLNDCVFENLAAGVHCPHDAALALAFVNTLHHGWGPLVTLSDLPRADAPISISLDQFTLRDAQSLLECRVSSTPSNAGPITIQSTRSVFTQRPGNPLVVFVGPQPNEAPWHLVRWHGQGSVVDSPLPLLGWRLEAGDVVSADEARLNVSGVVRGSIEFAGPSSRGVAGARVVGWNAPLRSPDPPGFDPTRWNTVPGR